MKIGIDSVLGKIDPLITSHNSAWAYLWMNQLQNSLGLQSVEVLKSGSSWCNYDTIMLFHENLLDAHRFLNFGIADEDMYLKFERILDFNGDIVSLDGPLPDYASFLRNKLGEEETHYEITGAFCDALSIRCEKVTVLKQEDLNTGILCLGDSHAISRYMPTAMVQKSDLSLSSFLAPDLQGYIANYGDLHELIIKLGDNDIRHDLGRHRQPEQYLQGLLNRLENKLLSLGMKTITLSWAMPVEDESRLIPNLKRYGNKPFHGTRLQRERWTLMFNEWVMLMHQKHGFGVLCYPSEMYDVSPLEFFKYMESGQSVHLSPQYFHWDLINNRPNFTGDYITPV